MSPDRLPDILRGIPQKARLAGAIARELLTHPFSRSLILIDNGEMRVLGGLINLGESYRRRQELLLRGALGIATAGVVFGGIAVWNLRQSSIDINQAFINNQQGQVATYKEFLHREREFLTTGGAAEILEKTKDKNRLPVVLGSAAALLALGLILGTRIVGLRPGDIPDSFWQLPKAKDPDGLVMKALLEEREHGR